METFQFREYQEEKNLQKKHLMQLFYSPQISLQSKDFTFDKDESRHIVKALRKKTGETLYITDGKGHLIRSEIMLASDKNCRVRLLEVKEKVKPWNYYLHLAIAPTKNAERLEWFLEKATEIGIDEITPILCERSERKVVKNDRLQKIIEGAMKQSLKYHLPKLNALTTFNSFIKKDLPGHTLIAHCLEEEKPLLQNLVKEAKNYTIMIGPEGDFSKTEIDEALKQQIRAVSLGKSRLRTETAGLVAVHTLSVSNQ